jgi:CRP-like cAMP-binding protein
MDAIDEHRHSLLLRRLADHDLRRLEPHLRITTLADDDVLHRGGSIISRILFPHESIVSLVCRMTDGATVETGTIGSEGYVGAEVMLGSALAISDAVAQCGRASVIKLDRLQFLMDQSPSLRASLQAYARNFLITVSRLVACTAVHDIKQRVCRRLLIAADHAGQPSVPMTQDFLARMLAVRRTSINLACNELRKEGAIHYVRGRITIADRVKMEHSACECYKIFRSAFDGVGPHEQGSSQVRDTALLRLSMSETEQNRGAL